MTDTELKQHVQNALDWEPSVEANDIGVSVDGVVTLRGTVGSYVEKVTAERVTLRVYGVKAVANDLSVHLVSGYERTDTEIAQAAVAALKWNTVVPADRVTVTVANGWVTLNGTLEYYYQSAAAERAVRAWTQKVKRFRRPVQRAEACSSAWGAERSGSATWIFGVNTPTGARRGAVARSLTERSSSSNVRRAGATIRLQHRAATASRRWSATPAARSRAFRLCRVRDVSPMRASHGRSMRDGVRARTFTCGSGAVRPLSI